MEKVKETKGEIIKGQVYSFFLGRANTAKNRNLSLLSYRLSTIPKSYSDQRNRSSTVNNSPTGA